MKITITSKLNVLKTWLIGGQIDYSGNWCEGFNTFTESENYKYLKDESGNYSIEKIIEAIEYLISSFGDERFDYYGDVYKFKFPSEHNMKILAKRIKVYLLKAEQGD